MIDIELATTRELAAELAKRMGTALVLGFEIELDGTTVYHRFCNGPNGWALMPILMDEVESIKYQIANAIAIDRDE